MDENPTGASTEQGQPPPSDTYPPPRQPSGTPHRDMFDRLRDVDVRRTPDRWLGGVAAGIAHRLGLDPLVVRAGFIVLGVVFGLGVAIYLLAWVLIPDSTESTHLERGLRGGAGSSIVLLVVTALVTVGALPFWGIGAGDSFGGSVFALIVLGGLGYVLYRAWTARPSPGRVGHYGYAGGYAAGPANAPTGTPPPPPPAGSATQGSTYQGVSDVGAGGNQQGPPPDDPARFPVEPGGMPPARPTGPRRGRRLSGGAALAALATGALLIIVGALTWSARSLGLAGNPLTVAWCVGLGVIGALLIGLGLVGRRAGFVGFLALIAVGASILTSPLPADLRWNAPSGEVTRTPTAASGLENLDWGAGQVRLDLTEMDGNTLKGQRTQIDLGVGEVVIAVPEDLTLAINSDIGAGTFVVDDFATAATDLLEQPSDITISSDQTRPQNLSPGQSHTEDGVNMQTRAVFGNGPVDLEIDVELGLGQVRLLTQERN